MEHDMAKIDRIVTQGEGRGLKVQDLESLRPHMIWSPDLLKMAILTAPLSLEDFRLTYLKPNELNYATRDYAMNEVVWSVSQEGHIVVSVTRGETVFFLTADTLSEEEKRKAQLTHFLRGLTSFQFEHVVSRTQ
jgi:hypothetical protein